MKKRVIVLSLLLCVLVISSVYAATYATSATGSSQGYTVTARAYWEYETGKYASKGSHTINNSPKNTITTIYNLEYLLSHVSTDRYYVTQYFRPVYYNPLTDYNTYGNSFGIDLSTAGPMSVDF